MKRESCARDAEASAGQPDAVRHGQRRVGDAEDLRALGDERDCVIAGDGGGEIGIGQVLGIGAADDAVGERVRARTEVDAVRAPGRMPSQCSG